MHLEWAAAEPERATNLLAGTTISLKYAQVN